MMRNDDPESNTPIQANPAHSTDQKPDPVSGLDRLNVPLSGVKLDIPFSPVNSQTNQSSAPAEPAKTERSNWGGRIVTTDQATARLTLPLRAKLWLVFGGFALLFIVAFTLAGLLFFRLTEQQQTTVALQTRLDQVHQLQMSVAGEKGAISQLIALSRRNDEQGDPVSDFEFLYYRITFDNNLYLLRQDPARSEIDALLLDLEWRHNNLVSNYNQIITDLKENKTFLVYQHWQESSSLIEDLTARSQFFAQEQTQRVAAARTSLENLQFETMLDLGIIAVVGALLLILLIWLANRFVISPMGRLNIKLGQLLYGQTARITDRLNVLEYDSENQLQKIAAARHDLKLPLSNIRNSAELSLILHENLPGDVKTGLDEIIETTDASANLINSLLARPDNRLVLERVDLFLLAQRVVELVDLRDFKVHLRVELQEAVLDENLLEHVLLNLLSNARKFSAGGIGVGTRLVELVSRSTAQGQEEVVREVEIWVWNDGTLIAPHEREAIFRPGGQTAEGRRAGGHGIGLSIVKSIVERHGGRVVVESHEKVGTTFRLFLPYMRSVPPQPLQQ
ncbi:MAG TPA: HAMP domain-containing sensor histidine kinase [Chloroflexia bacterium]|nr:HAMP domain-containing sensor histidine kinase [Chloroflexia bacterium]